MLKKVILETANPMTLAIGDANPDELIILTSISGLNPTDVQLFTGDFAREGGYYQGRRVGQRFPVFNFKLNPDYKLNIDVSDARALLYRQFLDPMPDSDAVQVRLVDDRNPDRYFRCYTEKFPADIFDQKPSAQVSTLCVDPFLKSVIETAGTNANGWIAVPVAYKGTADTGLKFTVKVVSATNQIIISNNALQMRLLKASGNFAPGDIVEVNTAQGDRYVRLNGVDSMALLQSGSSWLYLTQASNQFRTYGLSPSDGRTVITAYSYRASWWGV